MQAIAFSLKKAVGRVFFPLSVCSLLLVAGLFFLLLTRRRKLGCWLVAIGTGVLLLMSYPPIPGFLLRRLEASYPPLTAERARASKARVICVLGHEVYAEGSLPPNCRFSEDAVCRLAEAARVYRLLGDVSIVASIDSQRVSEGERGNSLDGVFEVFGIPASSLVMVANARDTVEEIRRFKTLVGTNTVVLVTSASHLRRAMLVAERLGLDAVPAPCGYWLDPARPGWGIVDVLPSVSNLRNSERVVYEYLGLIWDGIRVR